MKFKLSNFSDYATYVAIALFVGIALFFVLAGVVELNAGLSVLVAVVVALVLAFAAAKFGGRIVEDNVLVNEDPTPLLDEK